ncbi:MAG: MBL fold metallo-hydrolase [Bacteroidales bacterium]|nr:MBL fold metallo-hydrolase [Bacteroidales bacterium]
MKKLLSTVVLLLAGLCALAFDWQPKSNEALFRDMIEFTNKFIEDAKGTKAEKMLVNFLQKEEGRFESDPYGWVAATYKMVAKLEGLYPPMVDDGSQEAMIRRDILRLVDYPIHVNATAKAADNAQEQQAWLIGRDSYRAMARKKALKWLGQKPPKPGELAIVKVYNMGFIFRTSERCFAIDLCFHGNRAEALKFADKIDVMFLTHPHGDHYTKVFVDAMMDKGKTLFLPKDVVKDKSGDGKIISWDDVTEPLDVCGIKVRTFAGNQNRKDPASMPNNVYHLSFDGWTVEHSGDNSDKEREARLCELPVPDVAIAASWNKIKITMDAIKKCADYDKSKVVFIPSHENEFGHRVQQRESYWEDFNRKDRYADSEYDYLRFELMDIGESILIRK